jgi:hypothetical protein
MNMYATAPELDLVSVLTAAATKLERLGQQIEAEEDGVFAEFAPELHVSERAICAAASRRSGAPTEPEVDAYHRWQEAAAHLRRVAHRRLEDLDDRMFSVRRCSLAFRAYGALESNHRALSLQKAL